jgi:L-ascorbate metabolism protein UlaG (beta-lactamase superfamily)
MDERLTWLGHATVLLEVGGARLLTDPVLRPRVAHLRRHAPAAADPGRLDAVLLSHLHRDHLDLPTLRGLDPGAVVVAPRGAGRALRRSGREVVELGPGEEAQIARATVRAVPAVHEVRRTPLAGASEALGYVVAGDSRVYFAGDTEVFPGMGELEELDGALLPVWGWGPTIGPGHMDPDQAAQALTLLRPRLAVPIHWGTFLPVGLRRRHGHLLSDPPHAFAARAAELSPATRVRVLRPGEGLGLREG